MIKITFYDLSNGLLMDSMVVDFIPRLGELVELTGMRYKVKNIIHRCKPMYSVYVYVLKIREDEIS